MSKKRKVAVLGATGTVGQRFIQLLDNHPWFEVTALTGSERTIGGKFKDGCRWVIPGDMPEWAGEMIVQETAPNLDADIVFSALHSSIAKEVEPVLAKAGYNVFSNASSYRMTEDVPLLIPEVNADHAHLVTHQRKVRGWDGCIVTNCNCTSTGFTVVLKPLHEAFGLKNIIATSMQAISGAGYPGLPALDYVDNIVPFIGGEEAKLGIEPPKMLGELVDNKIVPVEFNVSAHCNRVPVTDGHTVCVSIQFEKSPTPAEVIEVLKNYRGHEVVRGLPISPDTVIEVRSEDDRPQPRRDRDAGNGMTTVVGRVREDEVFDIKMVIMSHNTFKGAAGGSMQNAELLVEMGLA